MAWAARALDQSRDPLCKPDGAPQVLSGLRCVLVCMCRHIHCIYIYTHIHILGNYYQVHPSTYAHPHFDTQKAFLPPQPPEAPGFCINSTEGPSLPPRSPEPQTLHPERQYQKGLRFRVSTVGFLNAKPYPQRTHILRLLGFCAQRPYCIRLLGVFDAKGKASNL